MPINISLPDGKVLSELPTRYRKLQLTIPGVQVQYFNSRWGMLINQSVSIAGHIYSEQHAELSSDLNIQLSSPTPVIFLQVLVSGHCDGMYRGHLTMHYLAPGVSLPFKLCADQPYNAIYLGPSISLLRSLLPTYPLLAPLLNAYDTASTTSLQLPYGKFSGTVRSELNKLKSTSLFNADTHNKYYDNRIADCLIAYLEGVHRRGTQDSRLISIYDSEIRSLISSINSSPESTFNVEDIALRMGITERALQNAFRLITGSTVLQYVQHIRMEKAKSLLVNSLRPVSDIGLEVGYSDPSFFIRIFRKSTGVAPGRYRSNYNEV